MVQMTRKEDDDDGGSDDDDNDDINRNCGRMKLHFHGHSNPEHLQNLDFVT